jgi:putative ABC transport system permease protein
MPALAPLLRTLGFRPLGRHLGRTLLTLLGVAAGVAVFVGIELAAQGAIQSFSRTALEVAGPATLRVHRRPLALPESLLVPLSRFAREADFHPAIETPARARTPGGIPFTILGIDLIGDARFTSWGEDARLAPTGTAASLRSLFSPGVLLLPGPLAERLGVAPSAGESLAVIVGTRRHVFPVAVVSGGVALRSAAQTIAFLDIAAFQERFDRVGALDWIDVEPRPGIGRDALRRNLAAAVSGTDIRVEPPEERALQMERMLGSYRRNLRALSLVSLLVGMLLAYNALLSTVLQRKEELALLRALGTPRRTLGLLIGTEAVLVGLAGGAAGVLLGRGLAEGALRLVSRTVGELYMRSLPEPVALTPTLAAIGVALGLLSALAAALGPLREGIRVRPLEFLREERPGAPERRFGAGPLLLAAACVALAVWLLAHPDGVLHGYRGYIGASAVLLAGTLLAEPALVLVVRLLRPLLARALPPAGRLAYSTTLAARRRLGVSVAALLLAFAIVWGMNSLVESFRHTVDEWAETTLRADIWVTPQSREGSPAEGTMPAAWSARIAALPEVAAVDPFRVREVLVGDELCFLGAGESDVLARFGFLPLTSHRDPRPLLVRLAAPGRTVFVSESLGRRRGLSEGSRLTLDTPTGRHEYSVLAVYRDYSSDRGYAILNRATYLADFRDSLVSTFGIYLKPGVSREAGASAVGRVFTPEELVRVTDTRAVREEVRRVMRNTFAVSDALTVIATVVALLSVLGTLAALVLERTREIGILKAIGGSRGQVIASLLLEGALLAVVGLVLGALTGSLLSAVLVGVLNRESFGWTLELVTPWRRVSLLAAMLFAAALVAALPPARRAAGVPPREAMSRA